MMIESDGCSHIHLQILVRLFYCNHLSYQIIEYNSKVNTEKK